MNGTLKEEFINKYKDRYNIKDLDQLTHKIRNKPNMIKYVGQLSSTKNKTRRSGLIKKINTLWKSSLTTSINNILKRGHNNLIFLGLCTYHKNHKLKVNINTDNRYFLNINPKKNARNIVQYNIDKYKKYIINGSFPLRYIDHTYLINQRNKIQRIYKNMNYKSKSINYINKWLSSNRSINKNKYNIKGGSINTKYSISKLINDDNNDYIYIGSKINHNNEYKLVRNKYRKSNSRLHKLLGIDNTKCYGYTNKWMALLKSIKDSTKYFNKGYIKDKPFIEELDENNIERLKGHSYLYKLSRNDFTKISDYKYVSTKNMNILDKEYVPNILNKLKEESVNIIKYKSE
jgi:hypothetical protein